MLSSKQNLLVESLSLPNAHVRNVEEMVVRELLEEERCTTSIDEKQFVSLWREGGRGGRRWRGEGGGGGREWEEEDVEGGRGKSYCTVY